MKLILLMTLLYLLLLAACASHQREEMTPGKFKLYTTVEITEDWCYLPDKKTRVNGVTNYNTMVRSVAKICVSLKSDDPERTLKHELDHAWRNAVGMDAIWVGHARY